MRVGWFLALGVCLSASPGLAGQILEPEPSSEGLTVVTAWFERWGALDGTDELLDRFVDLYAPDALHVAGPARHQRGTVTFSGHDAIRKMAFDFTAANERVEFRVETATANEVSRQLVYLVEGPWGGPAVAVEYVAAYTRREDGQRFYYPGAAFFQILDGKIRRARLYMATGELSEVEPDVPRR